MGEMHCQRCVGDMDTLRGEGGGEEGRGGRGRRREGREGRGGRREGGFSLLEASISYSYFYRLTVSRAWNAK